MSSGARVYATLIGGLLLAGCQAHLPATPIDATIGATLPAVPAPTVLGLLHSTHNTIPGATFTDPTNITNPFAPFGLMERLVLEGEEVDEEGNTIETRSVQIPLAEPKIFHINGGKVPALVIEDRAFDDGELVEVALDYYAQADDGTVYYLGENVDNYEDGKIVDHGGTWLFGRNTQVAGVIMPASPAVGDTFSPEAVPARGSHEPITEDGTVLATNVTVTTPFGTFTNCLQVRFVTEEGEVETKTFAAGIGVVREVEPEGFAEVTDFD